MYQAPEFPVQFQSLIFLLSGALVIFVTRRWRSRST